MTVLMIPGVKVTRAKEGSLRGRQKFSVALSGRTADIFAELKEKTDPDTDSEVFRNALRLNHMLLKARENGFEVCMREIKTGQVHPFLMGDEAIEKKAKA